MKGHKTEMIDMSNKLYRPKIALILRYFGSFIRLFINLTLVQIASKLSTNFEGRYFEKMEQLLQCKNVMRLLNWAAFLPKLEATQLILDSQQKLIWLLPTEANF